MKHAKDGIRLPFYYYQSFLAPGGGDGTWYRDTDSAGGQKRRLSNTKGQRRREGNEVRTKRGLREPQR